MESHPPDKRVMEHQRKIPCSEVSFLMAVVAGDERTAHTSAGECSFKQLITVKRKAGQVGSD